MSQQPWNYPYGPNPYTMRMYQPYGAPMPQMQNMPYYGYGAGMQTLPMPNQDWGYNEATPTPYPQSPHNVDLMPDGSIAPADMGFMDLNPADSGGIGGLLEGLQNKEIMDQGGMTMGQPGTDMNPYLAMAAQLLPALLSGEEEELLPPPSPGTVPMNPGSGFQMPTWIPTGGR